MTKRNIFVFKAVQVIAWIIFIGLCVEAGALIVNFVYSQFKPEVIHNLYQKLDLSALYDSSKPAFYGMYSFIVVIAVLKAYLFYVVILLLIRLDLLKPFSRYAARKITEISYITFNIGIISYIAREVARSLEHHGFDTDILDKFWADSTAFILMAAVVYVIAVIFTRGIELQDENDLTV